MKSWRKVATRRTFKVGLRGSELCETSPSCRSERAWPRKLLAANVWTLKALTCFFYRGISINISRVMTNNESVWRNCTLTASLPITGGGAEGLIIVTLNNTCITLLICYRWEGRLMCILSCGGGGGGRGGGHLRHTELVHGEDLKYSAWRLFIEDTLLCFKWIFLWVF